MELPVVLVSKNPHTVLDVHCELTALTSDVFQQQHQLSNPTTIHSLVNLNDSSQSSSTARMEESSLAVMAKQRCEVGMQEAVGKRCVRQVLVVDDAASNRKMLCR